MSVTIRIKDRDYTVDEARKIYDELAKLFKPKNNGLSYPGEQQKGLFPKYPFDTGQPIWTTQPLTFADSLASVDRLPT